MRFGHFDDATREYVITTPHTPYPWINYLGSERFFSLISHQAGGYSFYRDARMRRITRYRYNNVPTDEGGRYLFVNDGGDVWTPSYLPVKAELEHFEARHGLGYSQITGQRGGVRVESLFFVPVDTDARCSASRSPTPPTPPSRCSSSPTWSSRSGTRSTTRRTSSATSTSARSRSSRTAPPAPRSTTAPSTASAATTTPSTR